MSELAMRLKDIAESGVYSINCNLSELRGAASEGGLAVFDADLSSVQSKGEFLATIAQAIAAASWLGKNWDALADALGDLSWNEAPGYVLLLRGEHTGEVILDDILNATVDFWRMQGKPFWVFFA